jgi:hypothetical protein
MSTDSNNNNPGLPQDDDRPDPLYSKYSTEQLEIIFARALDVEEKARVKNELTKRYYRHYSNIAAQEITPAGRAPGWPDGQEENYSAVGDQSVLQTEIDTLAGEAVRLSEQGPNLIQTVGEGEPQAFPAEAGQSGTDPQAEIMPGKTPGDTAPAAPIKSFPQKFCFIATAAYGSPLAPEVVLLSAYRDNYLAQHLLGRKFIQLYYRLSPQLAARVSRKNMLQTCTRWLLTPIIYILKNTLRK